MIPFPRNILFGYHASWERSLSRKGCFSCKKLKIKCDEAKPTCEYCAHTDRECIYPDDIPGPPRPKPSKKRSPQPHPQPQSRSRSPEASHIIGPDSVLSDGINKPSPVGSIAESYDESIYGNDENPAKPLGEDFVTNEMLSPQAYNSMGTQLHMTRFELRLLRFFHDQCIPYVTFHASKKGTHIWRTVFPKYFASSNLVRQATYAMACLNLWPMMNLPKLLESDNNECRFKIAPSKASHTTNQFSHVFDNLAVFENSGRQRQDLTYDDFCPDLFSRYLIFGYAEFTPIAMRHVFTSSSPGLREMIIHKLVEHDFLTPTSTSEKIGFVEVLRYQLSRYHFANATFSEIDAQMCGEHETLKNCLQLLECCFLSSLKEGHPTPFFKFLSLLEDDFIELARPATILHSVCYSPLAASVFTASSTSCLTRMCGRNMWEAFVQNYSPLCDSDAGIV
ncbi:hypothetical protein JCM33374_g6614 [Metschnikowia sp. JCM 33374]|nr:hypothetical protein JCM33374_g6614 [Metschnikowia sp. JCM 33374]